MDFKITLVKALKTAAIVLLGAAASALASTDFSQAIDQVAAALSSAIPLIGGAAKGFILSLITAGVAALLVALENIRKRLLVS